MIQVILLRPHPTAEREMLFLGGVSRHYDATYFEEDLVLMLLIVDVKLLRCLDYPTTYLKLAMRAPRGPRHNRH